MKADGLAKHYDTLSIEELFRLRIRALARGDRADWERLDRAARASGRYGDYCARLEASDVLVLCTLTELLALLAKLRMVGAFRPLVEFLEGAGRDAAWLAFLDGLAVGWKAAGKRGTPPDVSDDDLTAVADRRFPIGTRFSEVLDTLAADFAGKARMPRDALAAFAETELGLSLDDLLGAWGSPALPELADHRDALDAAEPDAEGLALAGDVLRLAWRRHGLNDPTAEIDDALRERFEAAIGESA